MSIGVQYLFGYRKDNEDDFFVSIHFYSLLAGPPD